MPHLNRKFFSQILATLVVFVFIFPVITMALEYLPIIQCGIGSTAPSVASNNAIGGGCDFADFIDTINRVINWIISIAGVIFTISAIYGGFLYMTSGDNSGNKEKAKNILSSTIIGFIIILTAWLIVYTILVNLTSDSVYKDSIFRFIG